MAKKSNNKINKKRCLKCEEEKKIIGRNGFYLSNSSNHTDGHYPICKDCIREKVDVNDLKSVQEVLFEMNRPFLYDVWESSIQESSRTGKDLFGVYIKNLQLNFKNHTWKDSRVNNKNNNTNNDEEFSNKSENDYNFDIYNFKITPELKLKWGNEKFTKEAYIQLEKFYDEMMISHDISIPQHKKSLILMCKLDLKMDRCLSENDMTGFAKLHEQFQKLMQSSGFRPIDKRSTDEATGMRTFCQIFAEVEKDGFVEPKKTTENQDIIDKTIMYINNYTLKLLNQHILLEPPIDTPKVDDIYE